MPWLKTGDVSAKRLHRIHTQVAPLMVQGLSSQEIALRLGITKQTALRDMRVCKAEWRKEFQNSGEEWGPRILQTYAWMLRELSDQWEQSKQGRITRVIQPDGSELVREEPADPRWLSAVLATSKEVSTFLGLRTGVDTVARVEIPEATRQALAPMSTADYLQMINSSGGVASLTVTTPIQVAPIQEPERAEVMEVTITEASEDRE